MRGLGPDARDLRSGALVPGGSMVARGGALAGPPRPPRHCPIGRKGASSAATCFPDPGEDQTGLPFLGRLDGSVDLPLVELAAEIVGVGAAAASGAGRVISQMRGARA